MSDPHGPPQRDWPYPGEGGLGYPDGGLYGDPYAGLYGDPQMPADPYTAPAWAQPAGQSPPRSSKRASPWVWGGIAVALAAGIVVVGVVAITNGASSGPPAATGTSARTLALPASVNGYTQLQGVDTDSLKDQLGRELAGPGGTGTAAAHAEIGVFAKRSIPGLVFVGVQLDDAPKLRQQVDAEGVGAAVKQFVDDTGPSIVDVTSASTPYPPGPKGGAMRCEGAKLQGREVGVCAWGDSSIFAVTLVLTPGSLDAAATLTRDLRAAAEH